MPAVPLELLPRPRLIVWHGEPGEDHATDVALSTIRRTYHGMIRHGIAAGPGVTAGGNDWSGWHVADPELIAGMVELVDAIAPTHWTVVAEPYGPVVDRPCRECGHRHAGPALAGVCVGCPCPIRNAGPYPVQANADRY